MSIFKSNNKTTITLLKKECKRLEKERNDAYAKLEAIQKYQIDYEELINDVKRLKKRYEKLIEKTEKISDDYKRKLEGIVG